LDGRNWRWPRLHARWADAPRARGTDRGAGREPEHALFERYAWPRVSVFSRVRMAVLFIVLDGAKLVEFGTHERLMDNAGQRRDLFDPGRRV
jgi:hypothetical protein